MYNWMCFEDVSVDHLNVEDCIYKLLSVLCNLLFSFVTRHGFSA